MSTIKLRYCLEIKKVRDIRTFGDLQKGATKAFSHLNLKVDSVKFWYNDSDGDVISITSQNDFDQYIEDLNGAQMRLAIASSLNEGKDQLNNDNFGSRSEFDLLNQSMSSIASVQYAGNGQLGGVGQLAHDQFEKVM